LVKAHAIWIPPDDEEGPRPWCSKCSRQFHYYEEPKTWACTGCGTVLDRKKARKNKAMDSDTPNPMIAQPRKKTKEDQDFPAGATIIEDKEISSVTGEEKDLIE
jgi:ribosomal protein L37AE/L43A